VLAWGCGFIFFEQGAGMERILAVDIGGTNSRFAAFVLQADGTLKFEDSLWLSTQGAQSFPALLAELENRGFSLLPRDADVMVLAVAGAVEKKGRYCKISNASWAVDLDEVAQTFGIARGRLINDFEAQAYACLSEAVHDAVTVQHGVAEDGAPIAVVGGGTGLGKCLLVCDGVGRYITVPSEGGHSVFPFVGREELEFAEFILRETGRPQVIGDLVVTGTGLRLLHQFHTGERLSSREVSRKLEGDSVVLEWFARFYGRACHDYVLETMALGGLYIAGGLASGNPGLVTHHAFVQEFVQSDVHGHLLCKVPVRLNRNEESGLWGAAVCGVQMLRTGRLVRSAGGA
jgi:glucokinase